MGPYARISLAGFLTWSVVLAAIGVGLHNDDQLPQGPYVALGDSYTSGPKIPNQNGTPAGCDRSDHNYPALIAHDLKLKAADFHDVSCSGATIANLTTPQTTDNGTNPAQLSVLSPATRLVTLGIGGNDIDFATLIRQCVKVGVVSNLLSRIADISVGAPCRREHVTAGTDTIQQKIQTASSRLSGALVQIRRQAPRARIYIVGYPAILPDRGTDCARPMGLATGDVTYLRQEVQQLNAALHQQALAAGIGYVDTYTPSIGHDACSPQNTRWIEPLLPRVPAISVHPNQRGELGIARAVLHALKARSQNRWRSR